jgi:long-chain acyl-CoA synthetase
MPVGDIVRRSAHRAPEKTALIFGKREISYGELNQRVNGMANSLLKLGIGKGDRVAVLLHSCPEYFEIYYACAKSGGIFVPINTLLRESELKKICEYLEPRFLVFSPDYGELAQRFRGELTCTEFLIELGGESSSPFTRYETLVEEGGPEEPGVLVSDDDIMSIFLTSGTTGLPKGAMRTHRHAFIDNMVGAIELRLQYNDRVLMVFPFYHVTWEDNLRHILMCNTIVIRREGRFDPKEVLKILSGQKITICQFVPTMLSSLLQEEGIEDYDLSHFRLLTYAASPMPVELLKRTMTRFKCQFMQLYGQTETGPLTTVLRPEDHVLEGSEAEMARLASAGRPVVNYEVRIVDQDGNDVAPGVVGEIIVRSECMTVGYWRLSDETAKILKDGWLYTGDFGKFDDHGYVYIVDRKNDMIISGGKNIYPREIEELLYEHDAILEAAVIGVPDEHWGESVKAVVVLKEGKKVSEEALISFCKERLASYKKPRSVEFRVELPKNPTGKILKRLIKDEYWKGRDRRI